MALTYSDISNIHSDINSKINDMTALAKQYAAEAQTASMAFVSVNDLPDITYTKPTIKPFDTNLDFSLQYKNTYNDLVNTLGPEFKDLFNSFLNTYFPKQLMDDTVAWLDDVIKNGYRGIPDEHYNNIWNKARDRELKDMNRLESEAINTMASKGWTIPTGAMSSMLANIRQEANAKIASISREIAIKDVEVKVDMIKFAVQESVQLITNLWGVLMDYLKTYLGIHAIAANKANQLVNANNILYDSMYRYYQVVLEADKMVNQLKIRSLDKDQKIVDQMIEAGSKSAALRTQAAQGTANMFGDILKGMAASRTTLSTAGSFENVDGGATGG